MNVKELTLKDLRNLGKLGGATALLTDGTELMLRENYGVSRRKGVVFGKLEEVEVVERYVAVYPKIRTIKWNNLLVARRITDKKGKSMLVLTGKGYTRN